MKARSYSMEARAAAAEATRERILDAASEAIVKRWYDDVTLADVARNAGVSTQTVINHFGAKDRLFLAVHERMSAQVEARRYDARPGDVAGLVEALVDDYEGTGDAIVRMLALEEKVPELSLPLVEGRAGHRQWVETMFGAPDLVPELVAATDVYTWKLLRRDQGLSRAKTAAAIRRMVEALLTHADNEKNRRSR